MWRDITMSAIGHAVLFGGLVLPAVISSPERPMLAIYSVQAVTPQAIQHLVRPSVAPTPPRETVPQVVVEPDKALPKQTRRPKQAKQAEPQPSPRKTDGQPKGETASTPVPGVHVDTEFDYPDYLMALRNRIQSNWRYPTLNKSAATRIFFRLGRDGRVLRAYVEVKTGNRGFDASALTAVTRSAPFDPLPDEFSSDDLGVHIDFFYEP